MPLIKYSPVTWDFLEARSLIHAMQKEVRPFAYHIALGGSVLNTGFSSKDLDLYFLPCTNMANGTTQPKELRDYLRTIWGMEYTLGGPTVQPEDTDKAYPPDSTWINGRYTYWVDNRRIDVFIA